MPLDHIASVPDVEAIHENDETPVSSASRTRTLSRTPSVGVGTVHDVATRGNGHGFPDGLEAMESANPEDSKRISDSIEEISLQSIFLKEGNTLTWGVILIILYMIADVGLTFWKKMSFTGRIGNYRGFPFPLTFAVFDMISASGYLFIMHMIHRYYSPMKDWLFGPHFWRKSMYLGPCGFLFGAAMSFSFLGLRNLPANLHQILQTTLLVWILFWAYVVSFAKEKPSLLELLACLLLFGGVILATYNYGSTIDGPAAPPLIMALSAFCGAGLMVVLMRRGIVALRSQGINMSVLEITWFKITFALFFVVPASMIQDVHYTNPSTYDRISTTNYVDIFIFASGVYITLYQILMIAFQSVFVATSLGVVQDAALIVEIVLYTILGESLPRNLQIVAPFEPKPGFIAGFIIVILSCLIFVWIRWRETIRTASKERNLSKNTDVPLTKFSSLDAAQDQKAS